MRKTRKALALLISGMLALAIPFQAAAGENSPADAGEAEAVAVEQEEAYAVEEPETSGMCGDNLLWEYGEGTLLISGTGPMYDYSLADGTYPGWQAFGEQIERIDIESGVTALDLDAFSGLPGLREVWYGGSVGEWSMIPQEGEQVSVDEAVFDNVEITFAVQDEEEEETVPEDEAVTEEEELSENEAVTEGEDLSENETVTEEEDLSENEIVAEQEDLSENEVAAEAEEEELSEDEAAAEEEDLQETGAPSEKETAEPAGSQAEGDTVPEGTPADAGTEKDELTAGGTEESVSTERENAAALVIEAHPQSVHAREGEQVILTVEATGTNVTYQWQYSTDGVNWRNCTSAGYNSFSFSFLMKKIMDGRLYRCRVSSMGTVLTSDAAQISLDTAPEITVQPEDVEAAAGETVSLHVEATAVDAGYQWQYSTNGTTWKNCTSAGFNTDTFSFVMKAVMDQRRYRCRITAGGTEVISDEAVIILQKGPVITVQPEDVEAQAGETVNLHVETNAADAQYQWQYSTNGTTWKNCTSAGYNTDTFSFLMKAAMDQRRYRCKVTAGGTELISDEAVIILYIEPVITVQPEDVEAKAGDPVSLHVETNMPDAAYQWQYSTNGTTWKNCTSAGFNTDTFSFLMKAVMDQRRYRCRITAGETELISDEAVISLQTGPVITVQPEDVEAKAGDPVSLHVETNAPDAVYQWQYSTNGTTWKNCTSAGFNTDTFSFLMKAVMDQRRYRCRITAQGKELLSDECVITLASSEIVIDDVVYELIDSSMTVTGYRGNRTAYTVQETVNGTTVTVIGEKAFENNTTIQEIHLPDTIQVIKKRAFAGCTSLRKMN